MLKDIDILGSMGISSLLTTGVACVNKDQQCCEFLLMPITVAQEKSLTRRSELSSFLFDINDDCSDEQQDLQ